MAIALVVITVMWSHHETSLGHGHLFISIYFLAHVKASVTKSSGLSIDVIAVSLLSYSYLLFKL